LGLLLAILRPVSAPAYAAPAYSVASQVQNEESEQGEPAVIPGSPAVSAGQSRYFSQTAHFLRGAFLDYWETHGKTPILGLPITEPIVEDGLTVQYLERARLEWHPEISSDPNQAILLTRLGVVASGQSGYRFKPMLSGTDTFTSHFFRETGHNLSNAFLLFWQKNGGLAVFGYPISEEFAAVNVSDGKTYTVQYFERNRFEWHPEAGPKENIQLGLLGVEYARTSGLDPLARVLLPAEIPAADIDLGDDPRLASLVDESLLPIVQELSATPEFHWIPAVIIENRILVNFDETGEEGIAGAFYFTNVRSPRYFIVISNRFKDAGDLAIASILAHEATHAFDTTDMDTSAAQGCSIEEELRAYMNGLAAWIVLGGTDALAQSYTPDSPEDHLNRSLLEFNDSKAQLSFDVDIQAGRDFLRSLYGPDCDE
jgi:hypothetical protein